MESKNAGKKKPENRKPENRKFENGKAGTGKPEIQKARDKRTGLSKPENQKFRDGKAGIGKPENQKFRNGKAGTGKPENQKARDKKTGLSKPENQNAGNTGEVLCPVSSRCGGCKWINVSYREQLQEKAAAFRRLMEPYCRPEALIPMENPLHYRNKVCAAFGEDRKHNVISGIYEENSHRIVPVDRCLIENEKADEIILSVRGLLKSFKIRPYHEDTGFGLLRHVLVRVGHATGQIMVVLVLTSPIMPSKNNFVKELVRLHPEISTIVINVNDRDTSMVLGEKEQVIYGKGYIEDKLCGMTFRISARSFYQVNPVQTEKLYAKAMEYAGLTGRERVLDAYCGTGTIGLIASAGAGEVIGVELNRNAVKDAVSNARRNRVSNIRFYQNDAGKFLLEMAEQSVKLDVLFMDPPRSGSDEAFLDAAAKIRPGKIVYISCNPETLVRDLQLLTKKGYAVERCTAVDMFPFTDSLEALVVLQ